MLLRVRRAEQRRFAGCSPYGATDAVVRTAPSADPCGLLASIKVAEPLVELCRTPLTGLPERRSMKPVCYNRFQGG